MTVEAKICGLVRPEDARCADEAGADYLGVVFAPGPRRRDEQQARRIWRNTEAKRVGVFVDASEEQAVKLAHDLGLSAVQLHGSEGPDYCRRVGDAGEWAVWKAVRVGGSTALESALELYAAVVDGMLLEGFSGRRHGGVGARFDWSLASEVRDVWPQGVRLILAGGLNPGNVAEAIERFRPDVVDVSSGVETAPAVKSRDALRAFVGIVKGSG